MAGTSQQEHEQEVRSWGFGKVVTWTDVPNAHYIPHSHSNLTTHLILDGQMIVLFPDDRNPEKRTYGAGDRVDFDANRSHEVWIGPEGCTSVIGE